MGYIAQMLRPDVTVGTAVTSSQHQQLNTLERTRAEKSEMVQVLPLNGTAVLNGDDSNLRRMATQTAARAVTSGFDAGNDIRTDSMELHWPAGMRFSLHAGDKVHDVHTRLLGQHKVNANLAAVATALAVGTRLDKALTDLISLTPAPGRLQPVPLPDGIIILRNECRADQESVESALSFLAAVPAVRRGIPLGETRVPRGDPEEVYQEVGGRVADIASLVYTFAARPPSQGSLQVLKSITFHLNASKGRIR